MNVGILNRILHYLRVVARAEMLNYAPEQMNITNFGQDRVGGSDVFWGEISPCDHWVQIYEDESIFLDSLKGFVLEGLNGGEGVIIIATKGHLAVLDEKLKKAGLNVKAARENDRFLPLDASEMLSKFIINGWPDDELFENLVTDLCARAGGNGRRVRAFGEMVAVLWAQGHSGATVRLEHLWNHFCQTKAFSLFCAYPKIGFTQDADTSLREICMLHSRVITV